MYKIDRFFKKYYPGTKIEHIFAESPGELELKLEYIPTCLPVVPVGLNDPANQGADQWMLNNGIKGGILYVPIALDYDDKTLDFSALAQTGTQVYVNLRFSWASADGGQGTLPLLANQGRFKDACVGCIRQSKGVYGWSLTNEANSPREWPKKADGSLEPISPARLAAFFASVRELTGGSLLSIGGFDPFNVESGLDPRQWTKATWDLLGDYQPDYVDVHGYIRGPDSSLVGSDTRFSDSRLSWQYLNFPGCFATLLTELPEWARCLPAICSEFNHLWRTVEPNNGWVNDERAAAVIKAAKDYLEKRWAGTNDIAGLALYRYKGDAWEVCNNPYVLNTLRPT